MMTLNEFLLEYGRHPLGGGFTSGFREHLDAAVAERVEAAVARERERCATALEVARRFGSIDGDHHKSWVIDQMVRALTGDGYEAFVADAKAGEDGPDTYGWEEGIPP